MAQTLNASDVRSNWSRVINQVFRGETEIVVEKSGIPVVAIVSAQDFQRLQQIKQQRQEDFTLLKSISSAFKDQTIEQIQTATARAIIKAREKKE